jgi:XTP/dITP diphosphohydrolase
MRDESAARLRALYETVERLRAPGGCPWDRAQTHRTLRPYLLEETYEALEAIEDGHPALLREELGDLLLQVFMHCAIAAEDGEAGFDIGDVAEVTRTKMIHRHPHVFADTVVAGADEVVVNWERLKAREKGDRLSVLDGVPRTLPGLAYALGVQKRPARLGFDETPTAAAALEGLRQAVEAVAVHADSAGAAAPRGQDWVADAAAEPGSVPEAAAGVHAGSSPPPPREVEAAIGAMLFAAVALARRLRVDPEDALRARAHEFADRFRRLEAGARADGVDLHDLPDLEWAQRWHQAGADAAAPAVS